MKMCVVLKAVFVTALLFLAESAARAQFSPDSPMGVSAGMVRLFGTNAGCSASADVRVLTNRQEVLRTPMQFALLEGKMRLDFDMMQMKGERVDAAALAGLKQAGLDRVVSVVRLDQKLVYIIFAGARSYVRMEMTQADAEAAEKNLQIQKTVLGKETVAGRACVKNKVVVKNPRGAVLLEATTWNAAELKDFPVQIALAGKENTTVLQFQQIKFVPPNASQFDPPNAYTRFSNPDSLLLSIAQKQRASAPAKPAAAAPAVAPKPGLKPRTPTAGSATKK